jgi:hypothetical protein
MASQSQRQIAFMTFIATCLFCVAGFSQSADPTATSGSAHPHRHHRGFMMGVCVGRALQQQGVPAVTPGQKPTAAQVAAFKAARQTCHAQFKASAASASTAPTTSSPSN